MNYLEDVLELEISYHKAVSALEKIEWQGMYPVYPIEISDFMRLLDSAKWLSRDYQPDEVSQILANIDAASMEDIKTILTAALRSERFGDGMWISILKGGTLTAVIARAKDIGNKGQVAKMMDKK
jgi:hypothetical protein